MVLHCVNKAVSQGAISQAQGVHLIQEFDQLVQGNVSSGAFNQQVAAAMAKTMMVSSREADLAMKKLRVVRQAQANASIAAKMAGQVNVKDRVDSIFSPNWMGDHADVTSLEYRVAYYNKMAVGRMAEGMAAVKRTFKGDAQKMEQLDLLREMQTGGTGNKAAEAMVKGYREANEMLGDVLRANGAVVPRMQNHIPHVHSPYKVGKVGREEWIDFTMPLLDRNEMRVKLQEVDPANYKGLPMTDDELRVLLADVYESIRTQGLNKETPGVKGQAGIANKYNKERILHFKDDGWFTYNERFGEADIVTSMLKNLQNMGRDAAMVEAFGPNVTVGREWLKTVARNEFQAQRAELVTKHGNLEQEKSFPWPWTVWDRTQGPVAKYDRLMKGEDGVSRYIDEWFDIADGRTFGPVNRQNAALFDNARGIMASAQLGSAMLSATGDFGTMAWTAKFNGMEFTKVMKTYFEALKAGSSKDELRVFAGELGLVVEHLQANLLQRTMYDMDVHNTVGSVMADKVLRWSGLTRHTDSGRVAFSVVMAQEIASHFGKSFDQLGKELKRGLKANAIDAAMWDSIRNSNAIVRDGVGHVNLADVARVDKEAAVRLSQYISSETDKALITSGWKFDRFAANWLPSGQLGKFASMYKRYPVLIAMHHVGRMLSPEMTGMERAGYVFGFTGTMTVLGAVGLTLKDLAAGRDPRSWDTPGFWTDAFIAGGAGGIVADFVRTGWDAIRQKRSADIVTALAGSYFGPVIGAINDVASPYENLLLGISNGDSPHKIAQATGASMTKVTKYMPFNNFWPTRVFVDRWFEDNMQRALNKDASKFFRKQVDNRNKYYKQKFWWKPGDAMPNRMPDIGSNGQ